MRRQWSKDMRGNINISAGIFLMGVSYIGHLQKHCGKRNNIAASPVAKRATSDDRGVVWGEEWWDGMGWSMIGTERVRSGMRE
jgi:hypothetical protein